MDTEHGDLISVIIPVYQVEAYLDRAVRSVLSQTYRNLEIILVDDGSTDHSGLMCDRWAKHDSRIRVIHQMNSGQAGARNAGIDACHGQYVSFVDSDDTIDPRMIEMMHEAIYDRNTCLAICGHQQFRKDEKPSLFQSDTADTITLDPSGLWQEVFGRLNNAVWNKLYKREQIGTLRFPTDLSHGEDLIFNLQYIIKCKDAVIINAPLYHYHIRPGSITGSAFSASKYDEITSKDRAKEIVRKNQPDQMRNARKYCFRARMNVLRSIYQSGREKEFSKQVQEYGEYVKQSFPTVSRSIRFKEKLEFYFFRTFEPVYAWFTRKNRSF